MSAFSALRVYAIAHRNWQLSSIVFVLGFTSMAINIVSKNFFSVSLHTHLNLFQYLYSQQLSMTAPPPEYCVIIYGVAVKLHARLVFSMKLSLILNKKACWHIYFRCKTSYIICQLLNETSLFAVGIASIMANVAADTVVLSTTLYATYNIKQFANHATIKVSVTTLLLRDGKFLIHIWDSNIDILSFSAGTIYFRYSWILWNPDLWHW